MTPAETKRDLALALEAFYQHGTHAFWQVFAQTPGPAVAALQDKPEVFGTIDPKLVGIDRRRLHARIIKLSLVLLNQA